MRLWCRRVVYVWTHLRLRVFFFTVVRRLYSHTHTHRRAAKRAVRFSSRDVLPPRPSTSAVTEVVVKPVAAWQQHAPPPCPPHPPPPPPSFSSSSDPVDGTRGRVGPSQADGRRGGGDAFFGSMIKIKYDNYGGRRRRRRTCVRAPSVGGSAAVTSYRRGCCSGRPYLRHGLSSSRRPRSLVAEVGSAASPFDNTIIHTHTRRTVRSLRAPLFPHRFPARPAPTATVVARRHSQYSLQSRPYSSWAVCICANARVLRMRR